MRIEVISSPNEAKKVQGNVLETFIADWLKVQGYEIDTNVRVTGCELDLLCRNAVSGRTIYVECKAYNDKNVTAPQLRQFLGTIVLKGYSEGWFVTTGDLGGDAKGLLSEWEGKSEHSRMQIYTPDRIIKCFLSSGIISNPPTLKLEQKENVSEWILVIGSTGVYWAAELLNNGLPVSYLICNGKSCNGEIITDDGVIATFVKDNFSLTRRNLPYITEYRRRNTSGEACEDVDSTPIVEVEIGETWSDYRPARPEHFVGRKKQLKEIFEFLKKVQLRETGTRVFAVQGESGIGKSSFVAKIRNDANERKNKNRVFVYAVDVRAANDLTYIDLAFLNCLNAAQRAGFGAAGELMLSNSQDPLSSNSVLNFLKACDKKKQVVVLIFDQFEELYSKIGMYDVFNEAKRLFLATVSAKLNFVLGFAWKTDCSIPQDHPAYHFWQSLSDHRYAITLRPFAQEDAIESLSLFEKEIRESLRPDVRKYLLDNCQGLPWLLKKLCIHLLDTMARGASQRDMENEGLDIAHLFDQDIDMLSPDELQALKLIAANAPMDWFEAMQTVSHESIKALQNKRLILNKGKKLNLYWDIFREYVVNKTVPEVPFVYIPQGPSIDGVIKAGKILSLNKAITAEEISEEIHFSKKTTWNILTDLVRFGIAKSKNGLYRLEVNVDNRDEMSLLRFLRGAVRRHKVLSELRKVYTKKPCTIEQFTELMTSCIPPGHYTAHTLNVYSQKLRNWFSRLGYTRICGAELSFEDRGDVMAEGEIRFYHVNDHVFIGDVSPKLAVEILCEIALRTRDVVSLRKFSGWRNAIGMLMRLGLIEKTGAESFKATFSVPTREGVVEKLFVRAAKEYSIQCSISMLQRSENASAMEIGKAVARQVNRDWKNASALRVGGSLRLWARWILESEKCKKILPSPGYRIKKESNQLMMDFGEK